MRVVVVRHSSLLAMRGAAAVGVGLLSCTDRLGSVAALIAMFALYALWDASLLLAAARARHRMRDPWRWLAWEALPSGLGAAVLLLGRWPSVATLSVLLAAWALARATIGLAEQIVNRQLRSDPLRTCAGLWALAFGGWVILDPGPGGLGGVTWLGTYLLSAGLLSLARSWRVRGWPAWREPVAVVRWPGWAAVLGLVLRGLRLRSADADRSLVRNRQK